MNPLAYVGAAYACIWLVLLAYAWKLTRATRRLNERLEALERRASSGAPR
jgi:CcmD family protein